MEEVVPRLGPSYWLALLLALLSAHSVLAIPADSSKAEADEESARKPTLLTLLHPETPKSPAMSVDFPDPAIVQDKDGSWYAFGTSGNSKNIQVATAPAATGPWTYLSQTEPLPNPGNWTTGRNTWAPDVRVLGNGSYVMYYSGELAADRARHCIGAATSQGSIRGPFRPMASPLACHVDVGGAIDPSGFLDEATGRRYVVYKVDGNSIGHGGDCNNGVAPLVVTPIMLQEVCAADGVTPVGQAVQILDRADVDGPLVEAPALARTRDGSYVLLFSSHCFSSPRYNVNYAVARAVAGPYSRSPAPLVQTGDFNLTAPGGATADAGAGAVAFHANCPAGRCMFVGSFGVKGTEVIVG
ncbi:hypothetical protein RB595_006760 [Gaeumannomyces hyphopodioides]